MAESAKTVEVNLLGRTYRVACEDDERESLMQAVAYLDGKMNEIHKAGKVMGAERIAVMAALNVAHELLGLRLGNGFDLGQAKRRISAPDSFLRSLSPWCHCCDRPRPRGAPDEPDVTGKRPPCLARVREQAHRHGGERFPPRRKETLKKRRMVVPAPAGTHVSQREN
jgi:cell division protein ZapA